MKHLRLIAAAVLIASLLAVAAGQGSALAGAAGHGSTLTGARSVASYDAPARAQGVASYHVQASIKASGTGLQRRIRLRITVNGVTKYDQFVKSSACPPGCIAVGVGGGAAPLRALSLQANGLPDVVLGLFSGGAHCCFVDQVFSLDPRTETFDKTEHDFGDAGARIEDLGGDHNYEFVSTDSRIAEAGFTDYASSGAPIQIFAFANGRFQDVTRQYPARIAKDAAAWLRAFRHNFSNGRGLIAAWAADEDLLGHSALVKSELAGALKAGHLRAPEGLDAPSAKKFVAALQKLLSRLGYTS